jgi:hypothetical protein
VFEDEDGTKVFEKAPPIAQAALFQSNKNLMMSIASLQEPINEINNDKWSSVWGTKFGPLKSLLYADDIEE